MPHIFNRNVVINYDETSVIDGTSIDHESVFSHATQVSSLARYEGRRRRRPVIVSAGAMLVGQAKFDADFVPKTDVDRRSMVSVGNAQLFRAWEAAFEVVDDRKKTGQVLNADSGTLRETLLNNLKLRIISVLSGDEAINEKGGNELFAARVAQLVKARHFFLMTGEAGILDENGDAISVMRPGYIDRFRNYAKENGQIAVLEAAYTAASLGITAHVAYANSDLEAVLSHETGTYFKAR